MDWGRGGDYMVAVFSNSEAFMMLEIAVLASSGE